MIQREARATTLRGVESMAKIAGIVESSRWWLPSDGHDFDEVV